MRWQAWFRVTIRQHRSVLYVIGGPQGMRFGSMWSWIQGCVAGDAGIGYREYGLMMLFILLLLLLLACLLMAALINFQFLALVDAAIEIIVAVLMLHTHFWLTSTRCKAFKHPMPSINRRRRAQPSNVISCLQQSRLSTSIENLHSQIVFVPTKP